MTTGGQPYPSMPPPGPPFLPPPGQPPATPQPAAHAPRPHRRTGPLVLALVIGLVVGAGIVTGVWFANRQEPGALPTPIPIGLDTLPDEVLGQQRDDLALLTSGRHDAKQQGNQRRTIIKSRIDAYTDAYGGPGISALYGGTSNSMSYRLVLVNGIQPAVLTASDSRIKNIMAIVPPDGVHAPGTATTSCVATPPAPVPINEHTSVAQARHKVLDDPDAMVTCLRSDRARNFSIQLASGRSYSDGESPATDRAAAMAAEVDKIWDSVVG